MVWSAFPHSCLLFRMCSARVESWLFVFMYLVYSLISYSCSLSVWPAYESLNVFHFNLCMPLELIWFSGILLRSWLYLMLTVLKALFKLVFFNKFLTFYVSGLWYVKVTHITFGSSVWVWLLFFCLKCYFFFSLRIICNGNPLFLVTVRIVFHSCCFACSVIGGVIILFM
jgi:hypothetical protein